MIILKCVEMYTVRDPVKWIVGINNKALQAVEASSIGQGPQCFIIVQSHNNVFVQREES